MATQALPARHTAPRRRHRLSFGQFTLVLGSAVVAGTALILGYAAAADTDPQWDSPASVLVVLAAFWLPQTLFALARPRRTRRNH